jgi:hypothetical protein
MYLCYTRASSAGGVSQVPCASEGAAVILYR